jgi:DNA adenine methylase
MNFYSPLRYPGGKGKMAAYVRKVFRENNLLDGVYVEPYAGGASVALSLLFGEYASRIIINDYDRSIYAFWHSVLNNHDKLCQLIQNTEVTVEERVRQKKIQENKQKADLIDLGFSTFFLNRVNRSGIIKGGVIGGNDQTGNFKIDARYNKKELISRIQRIAHYNDRIELYNLDAIKLMKLINRKLPNKTLVYFDPPYYVQGKALYVNHYKHEDHLLVSKTVKGLNRIKWIVSYDAHDKIKALYSDKRCIEYNLSYSNINATSGREIMIYHDKLIVPSFIQNSGTA